MAIMSVEQVPFKKYLIRVLETEHFRVFRQPQNFCFLDKLNLVVFGPNKSGKTCFIDSLEVGLSPVGILSRFGKSENADQNKAGQEAIVNHRSAKEGKKAKVRLELGGREKGDTDKFEIVQVVGDATESTSDAISTLYSKIPAPSIIRGEELQSFVTEWKMTRRFEGVEKWKQHQEAYQLLNLYNGIVDSTKNELNLSLERNAEMVEELASVTNQKVSEFSEPIILDFINTVLLSQFDPPLQLIKFTRTDPTYQNLKSNLSGSNISIKDGSTQFGKILEKEQQEMLSKVDEMFDLYEDFVGLKDRIKELELELEDYEFEVNTHSELTKKLTEEVIEKLHNPMNEYYQYIQGGIDHTIYLRVVSDKKTGKEGFNLAIDVAPNRKGVIPSAYLTTSEMHSFALAFHLASIVQFNPEVPIIILDDVIMSYDEESRNRITALIAEKFPEHQFIITSSDRPFCEILKSRVGEKDWKFVQIVGFDPNYGPIFSDLKPTDELMQDLWSQGLSALWLMRIDLEQYFKKLLKGLGIKMKILDDAFKSNYGLGDMIDAFKNYVKEHQIEIPKLQNIQVKTLDYISNLLLENSGAHGYNKANGVISKGDEEQRWTDVKEFKALMTCKTCKMPTEFRHRQKESVAKCPIVCKACDNPLVFIERESVQEQNKVSTDVNPK